MEKITNVLVASAALVAFGTVAYVGGGLLEEGTVSAVGNPAPQDAVVTGSEFAEAFTAAYVTANTPSGNVAIRTVDESSTDVPDQPVQRLERTVNPDRSMVLVGSSIDPVSGDVLQRIEVVCPAVEMCFERATVPSVSEWRFSPQGVALQQAAPEQTASNLVGEAQKSASAVYAHQDSAFWILTSEGAVVAADITSDGRTVIDITEPTDGYVIRSVTTASPVAPVDVPDPLASEPMTGADWIRSAFSAGQAPTS